MLFTFVGDGAHESLHKTADIDGRRFDGYGVRRERIFLNGVDIGCHTVRNGKDECDADNTDRACERGEDRSAFFGKKVVERKAERSKERH